MREDYKTEVLKYYGFFWNRAWRDENFVAAVADAVSLVHEQIDLELASLGEYLSRLRIPVTRPRRWLLLRLGEGGLELNARKYGSGDVYGDGLYGASSYPRRYVLPHRRDVRFPFITDSPAQASLVLTEGVDYWFDDDIITFKENPFDKGFKLRVDASSGEPVRTILAWGYCGEVDVGALRDFYGACAGLSTTSTERFKRLVNAVWDLRTQGASLVNVSEFLGVMTDSGVPKVGGVVTGVWSENDRVFVKTEAELLSCPAENSATVSTGDEISPGDAVFDSFSISKGSETLSAVDYPVLNLHAGLLGGEYDYGVVLPNEDVSLTFEPRAGMEGVSLLETDEGLLLEADAAEPTLLADSDLEELGGAALVPIFSMEGTTADVERFRRAMAAAAWRNDRNLKAELLAGQSGPDYVINPVEFVRTEALASNMLFIKLNSSLSHLSDGMGAAFCFLENTVPAGTSFLLYFEHECTVDEMSSVNIDENVGALLVANDLEDEIESDSITDHVDGGTTLG